MANDIKKDAEPGHRTSTNHLYSAPFWGGYRRYIYIDDFAITVEYNRDHWKNPTSYITPYWLLVQVKSPDGKSWKQDDCCKAAMKKIDQSLLDGEAIALKPLCYVALSEVVTDLKNQIFDYLGVFIETQNKMS